MRMRDDARKGSSYHLCSRPTALKDALLHVCRPIGDAYTVYIFLYFGLYECKLNHIRKIKFKWILILKTTVSSHIGTGNQVSQKNGSWQSATLVEWRQRVKCPVKPCFDNRILGANRILLLRGGGRREGERGTPSENFAYSMILCPAKRRL